MKRKVSPYDPLASEHARPPLVKGGRKAALLGRRLGRLVAWVLEVEARTAGARLTMGPPPVPPRPLASASCKWTDGVRRGSATLAN